MIRALAIALVAVTAICGGLYIRQIKAELAEERAKVSAYQEAAKVLSAHVKAVETEREKWRSVAEELSTVEGRDEALNPYERAVLDRVRKP
ncbi:hypothetical protein D2T31_05040 [Sinirhodobacter populi]|uniref:Uncharacterized protein n=1 Tax=Paenirhodobacter populi TaxID=2306993 RepID=A0A443JYC9_9RHOB|nr:hypothetical protein [Sinirhodobacter populi]RWR25508.1 hypothetical protein D2T31_21795 [Sinirhodobacter populi]RWR31366.1 hypothetical protein D2T31_05040 [Sinirhodobacter populi]